MKLKRYPSNAKCYYVFKVISKTIVEAGGQSDHHRTEALKLL